LKTRDAQRPFWRSQRQQIPAREGDSSRSVGRVKGRKDDRRVRVRKEWGGRKDGPKVRAPNKGPYYNVNTFFCTFP
jgi:hypothetical protein